jgi:hypothetical protein
MYYDSLKGLPKLLQYPLELKKIVLQNSPMDGFSSGNLGRNSSVLTSSSSEASSGDAGPAHMNCVMSRSISA